MVGAILKDLLDHAVVQGDEPELVTNFVYRCWRFTIADVKFRNFLENLCDGKGRADNLQTRHFFIPRRAVSVLVTIS